MFLKEITPIAFSSGEESLTLSLHTPILVSPSQGQGLGGTTEAWLRGEKKWQK